MPWPPVWQNVFDGVKARATSHGEEHAARDTISKPEARRRTTSPSVAVAPFLSKEGELESMDTGTTNTTDIEFKQRAFRDLLDIRSRAGEETWPEVGPCCVLHAGATQSIILNSSFPTTYQRYAGPIRAKCRRLLGASSPMIEDVVQETFIRLWNRGPSVQSDNAREVMAWTYRTATRLCIDVLRTRKGNECLDANSLQALDHSSSPHIRSDDLLAMRRIIQRIATQLPEEEVEAAVLCRVDGLPQEEAARVLGISERTIRRLLERFDARAGRIRAEGMPS